MKKTIDNNMALNSVSSILNFLKETDKNIVNLALQKLTQKVDSNWAEIADNL